MCFLHGLFRITETKVRIMDSRFAGSIICVKCSKKRDKYVFSTPLSPVFRKVKRGRKIYS